VGDLTADEVGQAAVRERHVRAALQHDDLGGLAQAPGPRRAAHPAGHAADDDDASHRSVSRWAAIEARAESMSRARTASIGPVSIGAGSAPGWENAWVVMPREYPGGIWTIAVRI